MQTGENVDICPGAIISRKLIGRYEIGAGRLKLKVKADVLATSWG